MTARSGNPPQPRPASRGIRPAIRGIRPAAAALAACSVLAGCSTTVHGSAGAGSGEGAGPARQYVKLLQECTIVPGETIAEAAGVQAVIETFSGAVCRWRSLDGATDIQLNWFETGDLDREKQTAEQLGYTVENVRISGATAYVLHPADDPASCGAVARAGDAGVLGWWVHGSPADPCEAAKTLVERSVNRTL